MIHGGGLQLRLLMALITLSLFLLLIISQHLAAKEGDIGPKSSASAGIFLIIPPRDQADEEEKIKDTESSKVNENDDNPSAENTSQPEVTK